MDQLEVLIKGVDKFQCGFIYFKAGDGYKPIPIGFYLFNFTSKGVLGDILAIYMHSLIPDAMAKPAMGFFFVCAPGMARSA